MNPIQRWPIVGAIGALLIAAVLLDRVPSDPPPQLEPLETVMQRSLVQQPAPLTASWYCVVGSSAPDGYAEHTINVSNISAEPATATVSIITDEGPGPSIRLELGSYSTESVDLGTVSSAANAAAVVEVVGGSGVVGHDITTSYGSASGPCATTVNGSWYFASGSTRRDSEQYLALLNPFGEDVVLDVTFRTATRERRPEDLSSVVVPGRTVKVIDVSEFVSIEAVVATSVRTTQGRVVAEQLQVANGDLGPSGAALVLGTPEAATSWTLPAGRVSENGDHQLVILNPSDQRAELELFFDLSTTDSRASYGLNSVELTVEPGRFESLDVADLISTINIPLPLELGLRVESDNDVPVVVSRSQLHPQVDNSLVGAEDTGSTVQVAGGTDPDAPGVDDPEGEAIVTIDPDEIERRDPLGGSLLRQDVDEDEDDVSIEDLVPDVAVQVLDDNAQPTATAGLGVSNGNSFETTSWVVPYTRIVPAGGTVMLITAEEDALVEIRGMLEGRLLEPERVAVSALTRRVVPLVLPVSRTPLLVTSDSPITIELQTVADGTLTVTGAVPMMLR